VTFPSDSETDFTFVLAGGSCQLRDERQVLIREMQLLSLASGCVRGVNYQSLNACSIWYEWMILMNEQYFFSIC